ncbi:MAG: ATP/GTP-binding protein [Pirellulales bacterium]|nr:ATP/GTP-binding protein [Pirellulales bacterium]
MTRHPSLPAGSPARDTTPRANPFRSRRVAPGAIDYIFSEDSRQQECEGALPELMAKLSKNKWLGAIVGPHGSGKSTLVAAFRNHLEAAGKQICVIELHNGQRKLPWSDLRTFVKASDIEECDGRVLFIDGYEQLSVWQQARLRRYSKRTDLGFVVTAHTPPAKIPTLIYTETPSDVVKAVLRQLLTNEPELLTRCVALSAELIKRYSGNLREVLFALYDAYEEGQLS